MKTYADASAENTGETLEMMYHLSRKVTFRVAEYFSFESPEGDARRVSAHLKHVRILSRNAAEIY